MVVHVMIRTTASLVQVAKAGRYWQIVAGALKTQNVILMEV